MDLQTILLTAGLLFLSYPITTQSPIQPKNNRLTESMGKLPLLIGGIITLGARTVACSNISFTNFTNLSDKKPNLKSTPFKSGDQKKEKIIELPKYELLPLTHIRPVWTKLDPTFSESITTTKLKYHTSYRLCDLEKINIADLVEKRYLLQNEELFFKNLASVISVIVKYYELNFAGKEIKVAFNYEADTPKYDFLRNLNKDFTDWTFIVLGLPILVNSLTLLRDTEIFKDIPEDTFFQFYDIDPKVDNKKDNKLKRDSAQINVDFLAKLLLALKSLMEKDKAVKKISKELGLHLKGENATTSTYTVKRLKEEQKSFKILSADTLNSIVHYYYLVVYFKEYILNNQLSINTPNYEQHQIVIGFILSFLLLIKKQKIHEVLQVLYDQIIKTPNPPNWFMVLFAVSKCSDTEQFKKQFFLFLKQYVLKITSAGKLDQAIRACITCLYGKDKDPLYLQYGINPIILKTDDYLVNLHTVNFYCVSRDQKMPKAGLVYLKPEFKNMEDLSQISQRIYEELTKEKSIPIE